MYSYQRREGEAVMSDMTPLPWEIDYSNADVSRAGIKAVDGCNIAWMTKYQPNGDTYANAALIVKAVNCHDELVDALEKCANDLQCELDARYGDTPNKYPSIMKDYQRDIEPISEARAILAKVRHE